MKSKNMSIILIIFSIAFLILGGTIAYSIYQKKKEGEADPFQYTNQQTLGNKEANIHVVEFGDFKCPACRTWDNTVLPQLKQEYVDTGKVQFHFINFPFIGEDSMLGARAGEAVYKQNPQAFWTFYHELYQAQKKPEEVWITQDLLEQLVTEKMSDIDVEQFNKDMQSKEIIEKVNKDKDLALKLKVQGAPSVYVNGELVNPDYMSIKKAIEEELKK
ncbi:DsbA family protein [Ectobacillus sp. JY-23]|uniref:DsbA family protein n=1 Tax=Ectobacillus sp. JY-23 TaxID=2933872 RepID=UPI001FF6457A|nr:DsbA family protein [Ectobacillus sp. JY-23]UOY91829.1 DsbA family protein [Ectobacillus sp. JY-23]